jgi:hypothetical protein
MNVLLSLLLIVSPAVKTESARFNVLQDGKRIGSEEFSIAARGSGYIAEGRTRISSGGQSLDLRSRMDLDAQLRPTYYEVESKGNLIRLRIAQPVSELEVSVQGKAEPVDVRFPADGAILDDNFFHHYLILVYRAALTATTSVPTMVPQQRTLGNVNIRAGANNTYEIETSNLRITATADADGRLIRLVVPDAKVVVER